MIHHYSKSVIAAVRGAHRGCWVVEIVTAHAAVLLSVPDTPENRERCLEHVPAITGDLLDNTSHKSTTSVELAA